LIELKIEKTDVKHQEPSRKQTLAVLGAAVFLKACRAQTKAPVNGLKQEIKWQNLYYLLPCPAHGRQTSPMGEYRCR
jgi:hypothetical protein